MNRRTAIRKLLAAGAGSLFASQAATQDSTFRSDVFLVLLDVNVSDPRGRFVPGLSIGNFTVLEDGQHQKITVFDAEDRPVTMGILLDESRSIRPRRPEVIVAAATLIDERNPLDEVFVLHFNENVVPGLPGGFPFSNNTQELQAAISHEVPGGKTALYDAVWQGLLHLPLGHHDRKTLVLISDGGDTASRHNRRETLELVERSPATIYSIGLYTAGDRDQDPGFLRRLAKTSGGETWLPSSTAELVGICRQIAQEIRTRYIVGYVPSSSRDPKSFRRIEVRARDPRLGKLNVRTRSGYRRDESTG